LDFFLWNFRQKIEGGHPEAVLALFGAFFLSEIPANLAQNALFGVQKSEKNAKKMVSKFAFFVSKFGVTFLSKKSIFLRTNGILQPYTYAREPYFLWTISETIQLGKYV
jgi:hypothetical protein